jgi:hypothetical protein
MAAGSGRRAVPEERRAKILDAVRRGASCRQAARESHSAPATVHRVAREHGLSVSPYVAPSTPDPTPREIREACKRIRASWTPEEREKRRVGPGRLAWRPPVVSDRDLGLDNGLVWS